MDRISQPAINAFADIDGSTDCMPACGPVPASGRGAGQWLTMWSGWVCSFRRRGRSLVGWMFLRLVVGDCLRLAGIGEVGGEWDSVGWLAGWPSRVSWAARTLRPACPRPARRPCPAPASTGQHLHAAAGRGACCHSTHYSGRNCDALSPLRVGSESIAGNRFR